MPEQLILASDMREFIPIVAIGGGLAVAMVAIVGGLVHCHLGTKQRERTKREIAAYIAEGSMTPEEGTRILEAGAKNA